MTMRRWLPAAGVGLLLTIGVVVATAAVVVGSTSERRAGYEHAAAVEVDRLVATVEHHLVEMERLALTADSAATFRRSAAPRTDELPGLRAVALARVDGDRLIVQTAVPSDAGLLRTGNDLRTASTMEVVLTRVLTEADAAAGAPYDIGDRAVITVAAPVIDVVTGAEAERRASVRGAVVGALDVTRLLANRWAGAVSLIAPNGAPVIDEAGTEGDALDRVVDIRGRTWRIRLDAPNAGWPASAWIVLAVGITLSAGLVAMFHRELTRRREAEAQAASRSLQLERIADAGARLQQSLDLGELLPAFAVALAADFDLDGVSVALLDGEGNLTEAFASGERSSSDATIDLPLRRGWRAVGVLSVRPGRALDPSELTSLQALADLLAVAMSNAQLYEREQLNAARLRDLDALKNAFLGTVSHELRTSMTAIMGFGELLSDAWDNLDDDRRREMAARIRRSAGSLRHLVDDLLDFARLEQERLRVNPRPIDLASTVRATVDGLSPLLGQHELALEVPDSAPAWADPVAVERIVANLLSNAAKYSPAGTTVTVSLVPAGDVARLVVADQGPGIPPEERRRIFARFYRLETPESVRTRGAGIGLAILHDFAERSGAVVHVDDAPGGGARFAVDFPTRPIDSLTDLAEAR